MDKKMIGFVLLMLFLVIGLTGCYARDDPGVDTDGDDVPDTEDEFPNDPDEWVDSDGDGVGNNKDDFPSDASLSEITYLYNSIGPEGTDEPWILSSGDRDEFTWTVTDDYKFIYVNSSTRENIDGDWILQPVCPTVTVSSPVNSYTITIGNPLSRIPVTTDNIGDWTFEVVNGCDNQLQVAFVISMYK